MTIATFILENSAPAAETVSALTVARRSSPAVPLVFTTAAYFAVRFFLCIFNVTHVSTCITCDVFTFLVILSTFCIRVGLIRTF